MIVLENTLHLNDEGFAALKDLKQQIGPEKERMPVEVFFVYGSLLV